MTHQNKKSWFPKVGSLVYHRIYGLLTVKFSNPTSVQLSNGSMVKPNSLLRTPYLKELATSVATPNKLLDEKYVGTLRKFSVLGPFEGTNESSVVYTSLLFPDGMYLLETSTVQGDSFTTIYWVGSGEGPVVNSWTPSKFAVSNLMNQIKNSDGLVDKGVPPNNFCLVNRTLYIPTNKV